MENTNTDNYTPEQIKELIAALDTCKKDKFIRWQKISIEQFGYIHNLVLVIVVVFLGYLIETLKGNDIIKYKTFLLFCFIFDLTIILVSLFLSYNRLQDFRLTAKINNRLTAKINNENTCKKEIPCLRYEADKRGKLSHSLLTLELILLGLMIIIFSIFIFINYLL